MGNCMETLSILRQQDHNEVMKNVKEHQEGGGKGIGKFESVDDKGKKKGLRVKVVLTKEELKWLILQLNEKEGVKLEQVLGEIEKVREEKVVDEAWKPSLESIMEAPEMLEIIDR